MKNNNKMMRWTKEETELIKKTYSHYTNQELLNMFPRFNLKQIRYKARQLNLEKSDEIKTKDKQYNISKMIGDTAWTDEERKILIDNYRTIGAAGLRKLLPKRTLNSIRTEARRQKIKTKQGSVWQMNDLQISSDDVFSIKVSFERIDR